MALSAGTVISGYRIEAVLGSGGMGTVYRAAHPSLPRSDALKILSAELSATPDFRTRFIREADLAATLDHPNIVTVYNRGETDEGQLWIAMQYVQGSDADKEVTGRGMDPARAAHIIGEVAKALDYAHRRKLLHRDVKPANFLLAPPTPARLSRRRGAGQAGRPTQRRGRRAAFREMLRVHPARGIAHPPVCMLRHRRPLPVRGVVPTGA